MFNDDSTPTGPARTMATTSAATRQVRRRLALTIGCGLSAGLVLAACSGVGEEVDTNTAGPDPEADIVYRFAHVYQPQHPVEACGVPAIQEALEGTGVTIESFPAGQLGTEQELLEQAIDGSLDLAVAGPSFLAEYYPDAGVLDGGYLFSDLDDFNAKIDSPEVTQIWDGLYEESGLDVRSVWYYGTRQITSNVEVNEPADLQGLKIRTPDAPLYLDVIELMGGTGTPMALGEVYTGLQQGTIDAQENPIPTIASSGFQEVQEYINLTNHIVQSVEIVTSDQVTDQMDDEQQEAFDAALEAGASATQECIVQQTEDTLAEWGETGEITVNDDVDQEAFEEAVSEGLPDRYEWGDLYLEIRNS